MQMKKGIHKAFGGSTGGAPAASTQTVVTPAQDKDFGRKKAKHAITAPAPQKGPGI